MSVWTREEIREFDNLAELTSSRDQVTRISGRMRMNKFVSEHGKDKCDAMWAALEKDRHAALREADNRHIALWSRFRTLISNQASAPDGIGEANILVAAKALGLEGEISPTPPEKE